jgi:hypothetical protein
MTSPVITTADPPENACAGDTAQSMGPLCVEDVIDGEHEHTERSEKALYLALYVEIHSRLVSWWLINAWRSKQLADATWQLSNSMQLVPAAACARSLVETAAFFWLDLKRMRELWSLGKENYAEHGPNFQHYLDLSLEKGFKAVQRPNVLTQIDKLARATDYPL